jgi:hypothetical protein
MILKVPMSSEQEALESVKIGNTWGYVVFPSNYSRRLENRVVTGNFPDNETLLESNIKIRLDMSGNITSSS